MTHYRFPTFLAMLFAALCALFLYLYWSQDREPPVIYYAAEQELIYVGNEEALLEGVYAVDDVDGDVSDTLIIDSVRIKSDGEHALVRYAAKDRSGNLAAYTREVPCSLNSPQAER